MQAKSWMYFVIGGVFSPALFASSIDITGLNMVSESLYPVKTDYAYSTDVDAFPVEPIFPTDLSKQSFEDKKKPLDEPKKRGDDHGKYEVVPLPPAMVLFGTGLFGMAVVARRRQNRKQMDM